MGNYTFRMGLVLLLALFVSNANAQTMLPADDWRYRVTNVGVHNTQRGIIIETTGQGYRVNNPASTWADSNGAAYRRSTQTLATQQRQQQIIRSAIATTRTRPTGHPLVWGALVAGGYILENSQWFQEGDAYETIRVVGVNPPTSPVIVTTPSICNGQSFDACYDTLLNLSGVGWVACVIYNNGAACWTVRSTASDTAAKNEIAYILDNERYSGAIFQAGTRYTLTFQASSSGSIVGPKSVTELLPIDDDDINILPFLNDPLIIYDAIRSPINRPLGDRVDDGPYNLDDDTIGALQDAWHDTYQDYSDDYGLETEAGSEPPPPPDDVSVADQGGDDDVPIPPEEDLQWNTIDIGPDDFSPWADPFGTSAQCPEPVTLTLIGDQYDFSWQPMCDVALGVRPFLIIIAYILALVMLFRR